jgi:hypothetical protein
MIPQPGPDGTDMSPFLTVMAGPNHDPYFSVPSLYSW